MSLLFDLPIYLRIYLLAWSQTQISFWISQLNFWCVEPLGPKPGHHVAFTSLCIFYQSIDLWTYLPTCMLQNPDIILDFSTAFLCAESLGPKPGYHVAFTSSSIFYLSIDLPFYQPIYLSTYLHGPKPGYHSAFLNLFFVC